jgi:GNAT superfamily N-acetyltransferase
MSEIEYRVNAPLTVADFLSVLRASTLGERRPVDDLKCIEGMVKNANLTVCAWAGEKLVGVARSLTDFHYCCYVSDLAVDRAHQKQGIGKRLLEITKQQLGPKCGMILLSAPAAVEYYPHIGFQHHPQAYILPPALNII